MGRSRGNSPFQSLISAISDAICGFDLARTITVWNDEATDLFGYASAEAKGQQVGNLLGLSERDREQIEAVVELAEPTTWPNLNEDSFRITAVRADGSNLQLTLSPIATRFGSVLCIAEPTYTYPTEAPTEPDQNVSVHHQVIENSTDLLAAVDREERFLIANNRYREFHGLDAPIEGKRVAEVLPRETYTEIRPRFERVLEGETFHFETERRGSDGSTHTLDVRYYPIGSDSGGISGAVTAMREITELKQRARALRECWETYRSLLEGVPDPIIIYGSMGAILEANEATCRLLEYREQDLLDQNFDELVAEERTDWIEDRLSDLDRDEVIFDGEFLTDSGRTVPVEIVSTPIDYFGTPATLNVARDRFSATDGFSFQDPISEDDPVYD